jgi:Zn-dependent peptidase ImmA (M78 family)/transcriptional regulator with XRE-family HTH domain
VVTASRSEFVGDQLRVARELRGLTQAQLAHAVGERGRHNLTGAAISQFELGNAVPSDETMSALTRALGVDASFLSSASSNEEAEVPAFFRSLRAAPARERKKARSIIQLVHRVAAVLDDEVGLTEVLIPRVLTDPYAEAEERRAQAEGAAAAVRRAWSVDAGPVPHVLRLLERHGACCVRLPLGEERVDAFSVNFRDRPVVVMATDKDKWDRSRFDAAHELGHLVMHDHAAGVIEAERQADEFAAAFLMPRRDIKNELPSTIDWPHLMSLKQKWGVSLAALLRRAKTLEIMRETTYVNATKIMSSRGWRRHEPGSGNVEEPSMLRAAIAKAEKRGVSADEIRRRATIPADLFNLVCSYV